MKLNYVVPLVIIIVMNGRPMTKIRDESQENKGDDEKNE